MTIIIENEKIDQALKIVWLYIKNVKNTESKDIDNSYNKLLSDIRKIYSISESESTRDFTRNKVDELIQILYTQKQLMCEGNFSYVTSDEYVPLSTFNKEHESNVNKTTVNISAETAVNLSAIGENLKNKFGIILSKEQIIQYLIHNFNNNHLYHFPGVEINDNSTTSDTKTSKVD